MLAIGDELLSGRTKDRNIAYLADYLTALGIDLKEVRIVGDEQQQIVAAINALRTIRTRPLRLIGDPANTARNCASSSASRSASEGAANSARGRKAWLRCALSANLFQGHTARQSSQP